MSSILIIEDDNSIGDMMSIYLVEDGYTVKRASDGQSGLRLFKEFEPDLIVLDIMLPDSDGMKLCADIRSLSSLPILMVSAKNDVSDRVKALLIGADDYLCKPFSMRELSARIQALLRRSQIVQAKSAPAAREAPPSIHVDTDKRCLYVNHAPVETTFSEFELIKLLWLHEGKVFSREELLNRIRGIDSFVTERAIDVHIANLRKKIEVDPKDPKYIKTVWGVGYKFILAAE
ncbi:response regulator transcription factor [Paenibacillus sp. UNC499MF]|uniref:response regulator transcription factor n=1 Tax=Paenibacillus sp. UNC499MF TaxID=1502751 RepID=UPI00089FE8C2|nr:response regulator transcription factor [Paenibacillus sp. UNC499MF]SEG38611.1 DNA-binding response regulator, OmpR family, contains REC and winged-helix (wHTH) domain [Paenibacillus sp. UNC499MF]